MKPILPDHYQEKTWELLQKAVVAIQTSKSIAYSLEELYQAVENMCSHKMDSQLYTKLTALTESHVKLNIKTFFADTNDKLVCVPNHFLCYIILGAHCANFDLWFCFIIFRFTWRKWMNAGNHIVNKWLWFVVFSSIWIVHMFCKIQQCIRYGK